MVFPTKRNGQQKPREIFSSSQSLILPLRPYLSSFQDGFPKWGDFGCGESFCPENWQVHACKNIRWCFFSKWIFWGCSTLTVRTLQVGNLTLLVTWSRSYWMAGEQKSRGNTSTHSRSNLPVILVQGKTINCFWHRVGASWILIPTLNPPVRVQCRHPQTPVSKKVFCWHLEETAGYPTWTRACQRC